MKLLVNNVTTKLISATYNEIAWLDRYLSFKSTGFGGTEKAQSLYDVLNRCFPTGLLDMVQKQAIADKVYLSIADARKPPIDPSAVDLNAPELEYLRPYQKEALQAAIESGRGILELFTGAGKCLARGTEVIRYDGSIAKVEDIKDGDILLGPDSMPRNVTGTMVGYGPLYRIVPTKGNPWVCNANHVLSLVHTTSGEIVDVPLSEYQQWTTSKKHFYKQYQPEAVHFGCTQELPIDPYFLGIWLGDGTKDLKSVAISKPSAEILECCTEIAAAWGLYVHTYSGTTCPTHYISSKTKQNPLLVALRDLMAGSAHIPQQYLTASYNDRMSLLAGVLDTDGYYDKGYFEVIQKNTQIALGIAYLARSLGYRVVQSVKTVNGTEYQRLAIIGDASAIPTRIKKAPKLNPNKNPLRTGFKVESIGNGWFYGFSLDADHRFLLADFTVTHNTEIAIGLHLALSQKKPIRTLMIVTAQNLLHQTAQRFHERTGNVVGIVGDGACSIADFTVATFQSLHALTKKNAIDLSQFDAVLMDECHTTAASTYWDITKKLTNCYYRIALSATALKRADRKDLYTVAATGNVLYKLSIRDGVELNAVAPPSVYLKKFLHQSIYPYTFGDVYKHAIAESTPRNMAGIALIQTAKKPTIAFVKHRNHGEYLLRLLTATCPDLKVVFVHGKSKKELQKAKQQIEANGLDVLISTDVLATGTDIPEIMSLVNLAGMKAEINVIQKVGRAARKYKNGESIKTSFEVYDLLDDGNDPEHQSHKWLIDHANERLESYKSLGFGVHIL